MHVGVRRSPVHSPDDAAALARAVAARPGLRAGRAHGLRGADRRRAGRTARPAGARPRRPADAGGVGPRAGRAPGRGRRRRPRSPPLEFVNGGGTGSVERTAAEDAVTEVAAGSGLYSPTLFDGYRAFAARPAAFFAAPGHPRSPRPARSPWPVAAGSRRDRPGATGCPCRPIPAGLPGCRPRAPARCRPRCAARGRRGCGSATGCGSGTPRPARLCEHVDVLHTLAGRRRSPGVPPTADLPRRGHRRFGWRPTHSAMVSGRAGPASRRTPARPTRRPGRRRRTPGTGRTSGRTSGRG